MSAAPANDDVQVVCRGHRRPIVDHALADVVQPGEVDAEGGVHVRFLQDACLDHAQGAGATFFSRLEHQLDVPGQRLATL